MVMVDAPPMIHLADARVLGRLADGVILVVRAGQTTTESARLAAREVIAFQPDVILGQSAAVVEALRMATRTIPIVFTAGGDPVSNGVLQNIARPEGNTTGVTNAFDSFGGKWLELLTEIVPKVKRVELIFNPRTAPYKSFLSEFDV